MKRYQVLRGLNYKPPKGKGERRAEPGEVVDDLPVNSVPWLLERGAISPAPTPDPEEGDE
ncbi:hypothetical protein NOGI109294_10330 [Nocardiopsis gilva]|uniref:hypothetical protein n=1 Tax=Nocardiopsis gilva TaxID=280236 RepID=UPI00036C645C|nr:hypothetical protein [Nocardiopsis gilva]